MCDIMSIFNPFCYSASVPLASSQRAYLKGRYDAQRQYSPLFAWKGEMWQMVADDPALDDWSQQARQDYMSGYQQTL